MADLDIGMMLLCSSNEPQEIIDGVFLGSLACSNRTDELKALGITHILTVGAEPVHQDKGFVCKGCLIDDLPEFNILPFLDECIQFIHSAVTTLNNNNYNNNNNNNTDNNTDTHTNTSDNKGSNNTTDNADNQYTTTANTDNNTTQTKGKCLVHCMHGVSRSAAIVIAFVMVHKKMRYDEAHRLVWLKRPVIRPNPGFVAQLKQYELKLYCQQNKQLSLFSLKKKKTKEKNDKENLG